MTSNTKVYILLLILWITGL